MRKKFSKLTLATGFVLTLAFTFGCSSDDGGVTYGGETYQTIVIGTQTWIARNLNYNANGSVCYNNSTANCTKYGRLYNWATAKTICPPNWHLPSAEELVALITYVESNKNCTNCAGMYLKAKKSGWIDSKVNGLDSYGFSALPGGEYSESSFNGIGGQGTWWSSSENGNQSGAGAMRMLYADIAVSIYGPVKSNFFSVRCIQD